MERLGTLFTLESDLLLYDVTSTDFEGQARGHTPTARASSRAHRPDCKPVCIGSVVGRYGFPPGSEAFAVNRGVSTTSQGVVRQMEERSGRAGRIWAVDRGRIDAIDLEWPEGRGSRANAGTPKGEWKQLAQGWLKGPWHEIREGLGVRSMSGAVGSGTFLLLRRGTDGAAKVRAMRQGSVLISSVSCSIFEDRRNYLIL